ncbi:YafY family protein [Devosia sp.]|uniref:helix-turn-helix transcriptional regulator n=1 Tax=Devosia sp. TaxID=1871048 RepID=UPI002736DA5F|nr:WYL domain-containing protein [Devosia sp.]MDP2781068.1 WYL domain-containing protein [Devosia sp.]
MRYDKAKKILELARALASSAEGMTLDEMCRFTGEKRRTVERMRDTIREVFPQMEEIADHPSKRFHIPKGLDGFFQDPTTDELSDLGVAVAELRESGATARAESLAELDRKIRAAMRQGRRRATETDVEALLRAELIAVQAGPRPAEDPAVLVTLRQALLSMKMLRFVYHGGSRPGTSRDVIPFGIIFGRMNYLIGADAGTTKPKHWRLDRIADLECLDEAAAPPEDYNLVQFANTSFGYFEGPQEDVVLHVLPSGMDDFKNWRFHSSQVVETHPSGGAIVRFRASGMLELVWHLFCWGNKVEIIEPVSLREQLTTELRVALAHHEEPLRFAYTVPTRKGS